MPHPDLAFKSEDLIFLENEKLIFSFLNKYYPTFIYDEDVYQEASIGLLKAIRTFDPEKDFTFGTYAYQSMFNACRSFFRTFFKKENKFYNEATSLEAFTSKEENRTLHDIVGYSDEILCIDDFMDSLNEKQKKIVSMRFQGYNNEEIADAIGISKQRISQINIKTKKIFKKKVYTI